MNITVIGTGYVGLVTGACLAEMGNHVICIDIDHEKIANLQRGVMPIYEPGLETLVKTNAVDGRLHFVTSLAAQPFQPEVYYIAVGTPSDEDGSADLRFVLSVANNLGAYLTDYAVIVDKSTVPVCTAEKVTAVIAQGIEERGLEVAFDVVSNPEFLKEGDAINDFMHPDRVVLGTDSERAREIMHKLYAPFTHNHDRTVFMGVRDAEMTKYVSNAMLATKISFMNEMANLCELLEVDVENVRLGIGSDRRIGFSFIYPGCGYGGSCFPKDVKALISLAKGHDFDPIILNAVEARNQSQKKVLGQKVIKLFGDDLSSLTVAVWGLSFKPETDDMREASAKVFLADMIEHGAHVKAYDPVAMDVARAELPEDWFQSGHLELVEHQEQAVEDADVLVLITEWKQFRSPDFSEIKALMKGNVVIDGRNQYDLQQLRDLGFKYLGIGR